MPDELLRQDGGIGGGGFRLRPLTVAILLRAPGISFAAALVLDERGDRRTTQRACDRARASPSEVRTEPLV